MFHKVMVNKNDQRFLWRDDEDDRSLDMYSMKIMTFGATCSPSYAQRLKQHNARGFQEQFPWMAEATVDEHYVDDMLSSETKKYAEHCGLLWIRSSNVVDRFGNSSCLDQRRYRQFVACRVGGILSKTNSKDRRWISSKQNVTEEVTKRPALITNRDGFKDQTSYDVQKPNICRIILYRTRKLSKTYVRV